MTRNFPFVSSRRRADGTLAHRGYADDQNGERVFSPTFDDPAAAYKAALAMRAEAANTAPTMTLYEAVDALLRDLRLKRTKGTVQWYTEKLRAVCRLIPGETQLHRITSSTVEDYIRDRLAGLDGPATKRKCGPATVNADLRALHRVFAHAMRRSPGILHTNPVRGVERPREDKPAMDWFTDDELRSVLALVTDQHMRDVLLLFAGTGIRRSEAARLEVEQVRLRQRQLVIAGKTGTRTVPLSEDLDEPCKRLLAAAKGEYLLAGGEHGIDDLFRSARELVGDRRLHPHALRHTFGTALVQGGARLDTVMRLMGHKSITTTMRYLHGSGAEGVAAVGRLRLGRPA